MKNPNFLQAIEKYKTLQERERNIMLVGSALLIIILFYVALIEPMWLSMEKVNKNLTTIETFNFQLKTKIQEAKNQERENPNKPLQDRYQQLTKQAESLDKQISLLTQALVPPQEMLSLLGNLVKAEKKARLISLNNLPLQTVTLSNNAEDKAAGEIYRHGLELRIYGSYGDAVSYLSRIEALPWKVFIEDLSYSTEQYPNGILILKVYTLSTSQEIIGV